MCSYGQRGGKRLIAVINVVALGVVALWENVGELVCFGCV